jgi:CRISPR/Cas system-associated endoribonuclease Cas2
MDKKDVVRLEKAIERIIDEALNDVSFVQFCDNTAKEAYAEEAEVNKIIREIKRKIIQEL